jgi:hypothetical protein
MGWTWRKGLRFGPLRVNLSKSGVGYSVGVPGIRVGKDAKGRSYSVLNVPGTGIYRRDYSNAQQTNSGFGVLAQRVLYVAALLAVLWIAVKIFS